MRSALNSSEVWELTTECGIGRGENEFFRVSLYFWYLQYWALCDALWISNCEQGSGTCLLYRHSTRMYLMKEKQGGPIPTGLKRRPLKLIKHLADTTCISPSSAGPTGCCPLNIFYLVNLKFRVRAPNECCIGLQMSAAYSSLG